MRLILFLGFEPNNVVYTEANPNPLLRIVDARWDHFGSCDAPCGSHPAGGLLFLYWKPEWEDRPSSRSKRKEVGCALTLVYTEIVRGRHNIKWIRSYLVNTQSYAQTPQTYQDLTCHPEIPRSQVQDTVSDFIGTPGLIEALEPPPCFRVVDLPGRAINDPINPEGLSLIHI